MLNDALSTFTSSMVSGYRDGPFVGQFGSAGSAFRNYYETSWLAKMAVDRIPEDCFRKGYSWIADPDQISKIEAIENKLKVKAKKKHAMSLARLDGESYLYIDVGQSPASPLNLETVRAGGLKFINVLQRSELVKGSRIKDPMSEFYGQPEYYDVGSVRVHPSRILRIVRNPDPSTGDGRSDLVHTLASIVAAETARDNVVALTTEARIDVMSVSGLMDAVSDPATESQLVRRYELVRQLKATNKMIVLDKEGEDYQQKTSSFASLPDVIESMRREVCGSLEIPYSLVYGRAGGIGSNGDVDLVTYYDSISTIQKNDIEPSFATLDECVIRSALGVRPEEIYLEWASLWEMTAKEKAEVGKITADTVSALVTSGVVSADVLTQPTINSFAELGALPGIEQSYNDWVAGGGDLEDDPADVLGTNGSKNIVSDSVPMPLYVSRKVVNSKEITEWAKSQGFTNILSDLHVTITYSRDPVNWMKMGQTWLSDLKIEKGGPRLVDQLGDAKVLLFASSDLSWRNREMREMGASWDYTDYTPHITISYDDMPDNVTAYTGKIILGPEIFELIDGDWKSNVLSDMVQE